MMCRKTVREGALLQYKVGVENMRKLLGNTVWSSWNILKRWVMKALQKSVQSVRIPGFF